MGRISNIIAAVLCAATAIALPGDLVVLSDMEVRPDEAAGLYYLGSCRAGYLYNGSSAAVGAVAPYRLLSRDAQARDFYIVWAPEWVGVTPEAFAHLGTAVKLSEYEILVGLERGLGVGALRAVEHRIELIKLAPVTPVDFEVDAEEPPTRKSRTVASAVNSITAQEYAGYIRKLQDFKTRYTGTAGSRAARDYIRGFFNANLLQTSLFPFEFVTLEEVYYPGTPGKIFVSTDCYTFERTRDGGTTWENICAQPTNSIAATFWFDENVGFVLGKAASNNLVKTTDGGSSWSKVSSVSLAFGVKAMYFADALTGWIGGETNKGFILKTADGGKTWREQTIPADFGGVETIRFFDARHGWAGDNDAVLYTEDGGTTWRRCTSPFTFIGDFAATAPKEAWAVSNTQRLLHTGDGMNWTWVDPGLGSYYSCIEFPDAAHGFAAGGTIIATANGGATWRELPDAPSFGYRTLSFADESHGVAGDTIGRNLYRTDDGGESFVSIAGGIDMNEYNVVGERRGTGTPDEIVIIGGHFDSISGDQCPSLCPGAEDNGSGTACAMAAARALRNMPFKRTVRYIAFGAEEHGLVGSRAYANYCAAQGEKIVAVLNADMVCYDEDSGARDDFVAGSRNHGVWLYDYLKAVGNLYGQNLIYDKGFGVSDDASFENAGYPALGVIEGGEGSGGFLEYPYYHSTEDTLDKLHPKLGVRFVRDYTAMFAHLAGFDETGVEEPRLGTAVPFSRAFAVYPNPYCFATSAGGVNFVGVKSPATVQVYDLAGRRVMSAAVSPHTDEFVWRPGGGALSPGVYLYRVSGQRQEESGKIVISR
jgi:photosystem II stability/assembly factor-like uncharacterized protein